VKVVSRLAYGLGIFLPVRLFEFDLATEYTERLIFKIKCTVFWGRGLFVYPDSSVDMAKSYELDSRGSNPSRSMFLYSTTSRPALGTTHLLTKSVPGALSPGLKRPGREADHSPLSRPEIKNGGAIRPHPHTIS
jgi:hypothetical protein